MSWCVIYLASPRNFTTGPSPTGYLRYDVLKTSLILTRRALPSADIYVFHEDYTETDINGLPPVTQYIKIDFSGFETIYNRALPTSRGYLMMCRFFSGAVQRHPVLQKYTHYMRLDDDSYFLEPQITSSTVESMMKHDYVFRTVFYEKKDQQSLFDFTMKFIRQFVNPIQMLQIKRKLVSRQFITESGIYTGIAPYNNFHVSSLRLWNHPRVRQYIDAIEASGGIFRNGWLDANIHAMIVYVFPYIIPSLSVATNTTFGYRHNHHVCPVGSINVVFDVTIPFCPSVE